MYTLTCIQDIYGRISKEPATVGCFGEKSWVEVEKKYFLLYTPQYHLNSVSCAFTTNSKK